MNLDPDNISVGYYMFALGASQLPLICTYWMVFRLKGHGVI